MIDVFSINVGDIVEYGPYICSESLKHERSTGIYQSFTFWSHDERPVEMWLELIGQGRNAGLNILVRASQVTNIYRAE